MNKTVEYLMQLDLSESEAQMYLCLLKTGPLSVRDLALTIGIKRTTAYIYIENLVEKGLIIKLVKKSRSQVAANPPEDSLQHLVENKIESDKNIQKELPDVIKTIQESAPIIRSDEEVEIRYYKGKQGVKKIYDEVLQAKELRSYVDLSKIREVLPENFQLFKDAFKRNPNINMFEVVEDSMEARKYIEILAIQERHMYKLLPEGIKLTAQDIVIYDNKVAIIHLKNKISGVILYNTDLYNNFKMLFDFMWKMLPKIQYK